MAADGTGAPARVLWGARGSYVTAVHSEWFGAAEAYHFAQCGHWLPAEAVGEISECSVRLFSG